MSLDLSTVVVRSTDILASEIDGEAVMLSIEHGKYYGLDGVGTDIWNLVAEPRSVADVCEALLQQYHVDPDTCRDEVREFLELLLADGSVTIVG